MKNTYTLFAILISILCGCIEQKDITDNSSTLLWYEQPAEKWIEALPLGNGRMGAMVFGGVETETVQLNEESLWAGEPVESYPENFKEGIKEVQNLVLNGEIAEAKRVGLEKLTARPTSFRSFQPLCDIEITTEHKSDYSNYTRDLNLQTGISETRYKADDVNFVREYFISAEHNVVVIRISSDSKGAISGAFQLKREKDAVFSVDKEGISMKGQIIDIEAPDAYDDNPGGSGPGGEHMKFFGKMKVRHKGGELTVSDEKLMFSDCDDVVLIFTAATDYNPELMNYDRSIDPEGRVNTILEKISDKPYGLLKLAHANDHKSMFNRVSIELDTSEISILPTDKRLEAVSMGQADPQFSALYFQFGRYLLMSSSRNPGVLPANLQGIWNNRMWAPWEADYHLNINLQMNYWPADLCNLSETVEPLSSWLNGAARKGEESAKRLYGSDGWVLYTATNPFGRSTPSASSIPSQFMNGSLDPLPGAWMALSLWRHYQFTLDEDYLEDEVLHLLKGASRFLLDYMVEDGNGNLVVVPSTSPENSFIDPDSGETLRITRGSTYHTSIVREVLSSTLEALDILEYNTQLEDEIIAALEKITPTRIGSDGTIMEWIEEYKEAQPGHRHVSHLIGLHPFAQITPENKDLFKAAGATVARRLSFGGGQTGWSRAWMVNFAARLQDGDGAAEHLNKLYSNSTNTNLFDEHPPFQIDGNFGGTSGIGEMLLQSHTEYIHILPAIPGAWKNGKVNGLCARGGFVFDIEWTEGELTGLGVGSRMGGICKIKYKDTEVELDTKAGIYYNIKELIR